MAAAAAHRRLGYGQLLLHLLLLHLLLLHLQVAAALCRTGRDSN